MAAAPQSSAKLTGKTVLVVGASSGIGEALAYKYAEKKWHVIVAARREAKLVAVVKNCESRGAASAAFFVCDVTVRQHDLISRATKNGSAPLDMVVYSAGQAMHSLFADVRNVEDVMPRIMGVNFYGAGFFESLQNEEQGVSITIACPGYVATEFDGKKILADGSVGNPELNTDPSKYASAKSVADQIYDAAKKRKTKAMLDSTASLGVTMYGLFPGTINSAVKKEMKAIAPAAEEGGKVEKVEKGDKEKEKERVKP